MKRYAIEASIDWSLQFPSGAAVYEDREDDDGKYVYYDEAQSEIARLTAEVERLRWLCHSYFQSHCGTEAEDDECLDLYKEGVFFDGELRERGVADKQLALPACKPCDDELTCPACGETYSRGLQHAGWRQRPDGSEYVVFGCCPACVDAQPGEGT